MIIDWLAEHLWALPAIACAPLGAAVALLWRYGARRDEELLVLRAGVRAHLAGCLSRKALHELASEEAGTKSPAP